MANQIILKVVGKNSLHCAGCERAVKFALSQLRGVNEVQANHKTQQIEVDLSSGETSAEEIIAELRQIGYEVEVA